MIVIDHTIVSDDIADKMFVCHIEKCKGACCEEGELGAPLNEDELPVLEEIYEHVKPYLSEEAIRVIKKHGKYVRDFEGDFSTPIIKGRACVYATYDEKGKMHCGIERAYLDGKISYRKPISCHLYPIRITQYDEFDALNYHQWDICSDACALGKQLGVPLYKFLKEPLIRKYGEAWYEKLVAQIEQGSREDEVTLQTNSQ